MLLHETLHVKRGDLLSKLFSLLIIAIHWFNPLAYLVNKRIIAESELACDAAVLKYISEGQRIKYGETVFHAAKRSLRQTAVVSAFSDSGKNLKQRLSAIIEGKNTRRRDAILCAFVVPACIILTGMIGYSNETPKCGSENRNQYSVCHHEPVLTFRLNGNEKNYSTMVVGLEPGKCYYFVPSYLIRYPYIYEHIVGDYEAIAYLAIKP